VGTASTHTKLHVWDLASGQQRFAIQGPFQGGREQLAFSPDSTRITCAGGDPRVGLWDATSGKELAMYRGHTSNVCAVAFSSDGRQLLSADATHAIKVWDAHPRADALVLKPGDMAGYAAVSPDAQRIATFSFGPAGGIKVWDFTGKQLLSLKRSTAHENEGDLNRVLVFSPKGDRLACGTTSLDAGKVWDGLTVWDAAGKELLNLDEEGVGLGSVALSPDGTRVAAAASASRPRDLNSDPAKMTLRVWEVATGRQVLTIERPSYYWGRITYSADGARLAAIDGAPSPWQPQPSQILVFDATTGNECAHWQGPTGLGTGIAFSPDGRRVAATVGDFRHHGELLVGDLVSGGLMKLGRAQGSVVFSPDGARLAAYSALSPQPAEVSLWDVATGRQLLVLKGHRGASAFSSNGIAFSPSGDRIVSTADLWETNAVEVKTWDATPLPAAGRP
jgi:WD40 repeat protein